MILDHANTEILNTLLRLRRRSENEDIRVLENTFVSLGSLNASLEGYDHQIIYGRRGTGKTHTLRYLGKKRVTEGDIVVYIDMRKIGSTGGIYNDINTPISQRASRLLIDLFSHIHDELFNHIVNNDNVYNLSKFGPLLDNLAHAVCDVNVVEGEVERYELNGEKKHNVHTDAFSFSLNKEIGIELGHNHTSGSDKERVITELRKGKSLISINFNTLSKALNSILQELSPRRMWILLDEWVEISSDIQPYLADTIKKSLLVYENLTMKIASIEYRSYFRRQINPSLSIGFEVGADIASVVNLDNYMVFNNEPGRAKEFFQKLIYLLLRSEIVGILFHLPHS